MTEDHQEGKVKAERQQSPFFHVNNVFIIVISHHIHRFQGLEKEIFEGVGILEFCLPKTLTNIPS